MIKIASIYDVDQNELIEKAALELKKVPEIAAPKWAVFAKTGAHKERPPIRDDWWFMRSASILRRIAMKGPIGTSKLRTLYGGKRSRGMAPERFCKGSGSIIRKAMQGLEKAGLVKQYEKKGHKGRVITPKGASLLDKAATAVQKEEPKEAKPKAVVAEKKAVHKAEKPKSPAAEEKKPEHKPIKKAEEKKAEPEVKKAVEKAEKPVEAEKEEKAEPQK